VHFLKNIFLIIVVIVLTVALQAVTLTSAQTLNNNHATFQTQSQNYKKYEKDITLSQIIYDEKTTKGLMSLIITHSEQTFKNIKHKKFIEEVYQRKTYRPIWFNNKGLKKEALYDLFHHIENDQTLEASGYIKIAYRKLRTKISETKERTIENELMLDLELTALYKSFMQQHLYGSIQWWKFQKKLRYLRQKDISANWVTHTPKYDLTDMLLRHKISYIVAATTPSSFNYKYLYKELTKLRKIEKSGGWKKIPNSSQLRYGKSGKHVKLLAQRLKSEGDYTCKEVSSTFGQCLKKAIKRFQKRHNTTQSGVINKTTLRKLNTSVNWKIKKILLNLDRIKRLPDQAEDRYVMVNIPEFRLYYKENGRDALTMRVIVGDKEHHTPIFSHNISYIVLNPYWFMPDSIVKNEMIPSILKNPDFLEQRGYEVRKNYSTRKPAMDTSNIDWENVLKTNQTKKYKFMQPPGPKNALGKIKFKFPNQFAVYLHDTPTKKLFNEYPRAFSHGCIRISKPKALLATFAKHERFSYGRSKSILKGKNRQQYDLQKPTPVHIIYLTSYAKSDGLVYYFPDIYNYDSKQSRTIN